MNKRSPEQVSWQYDVTLPPGYNNKSASGSDYPVVYVLDGQLHRDLVVALVRFLVLRQLMPEVIVVSITARERFAEFTPTHSALGPSGKAEEACTGSGQAHTLLHWLTQGLFPAVERQYRCRAERVLVGYSLSGLFSLYALIEAADSISAVIAVDPSLWWDNSKLLDTVAAPPASNSAWKRVYLCSATTPQYRHLKMPENALTAAQRLQQFPAHFTVNYEHFDKETHTSVPVVALCRGLRFVFHSQQE